MHSSKLTFRTVDLAVITDRAACGPRQAGKSQAIPLMTFCHFCHESLKEPQVAHHALEVIRVDPRGKICWIARLARNTPSSASIDQTNSTAGRRPISLILKLTQILEQSRPMAVGADPRLARLGASEHPVENRA